LTGRDAPTTLRRRADDRFLIDKRVVERNIKKGLVDQLTLAQQIEGLPDRESNCVHVSLEGNVHAAQPSLDDSLDSDDLDDEDDDDDDDDDSDDDDDKDEAVTDDAQG
jgi:hypothetical protein